MLKESAAKNSGHEDRSLKMRTRSVVPTGFTGMRRAYCHARAFAVLASKRFAELAKDPKVVAAAVRCRELQECHRLYARAEHLSKVDMNGARKLFAEVLGSPTERY